MRLLQWHTAHRYNRHQTDEHSKYIQISDVTFHSTQTEKHLIVTKWLQIIAEIWRRGSFTCSNVLGSHYLGERHDGHFIRMQLARDATTEKCNLTGLQKKKTASTCRRVGTSLQKKLRTRKNREARCSNHKVAWRYCITIPPKTLFVAQTTHMAGKDSWAHESNHRLDYHSTEGAPTWGRSAIRHRTRHGHNDTHLPTTITSALGRQLFTSQSKKGSHSAESTKKSTCIYIFIVYIYISKMLYKSAKAKLRA